MASRMNTKDFFGKGTPNQIDFTLNQYDQALRLKAESKSSKPENVIKLDKWYQNELPKKIKSRGKDAHLVHDELVQTIKWKLARGKFRPNLVNLVQMNTPRVAMVETKKAFRKLSKTGDLQSAAQSLCTLKGVGPGMASAVLAAGAPHIAPFMADECLLSMPEVDGLDYTMKEYMRYVEYVKENVERLNSQSPGDPKYTPHILENAVWTHYILYDLKPELLEDMPEAKVEKAVAATPAEKDAAASGDPAAIAAASEAAKAAAAAAPTTEEPSENNGQVSATISADEDTKSSMASSMDEDSNSAKNHNNTHTIAETPSAPAATAPVEAPKEASEKVEEVAPEVAPEVVAVENGNKIIEAEASEVKETAAVKEPKAADSTPKTNGNNSHSNGSAGKTTEQPETEPKPSVEPAPIAKEQDQQNGATAANNDNEKIEAKASEVEPKKLENGVKSSEKESTDLRSPASPPASAKRSLDKVEPATAAEATPEQPAAKKLKTCEENATAAAKEAVGAASEAAAATPAAATTTPQVAV